MPAWPPVPRVGDGVIGSPPAFGAVQSRFESESPSRLPTCRRPRRSVIPQEPSVPVTAGGPALAAVVVLAAGQGTRMRSSTPKVLHTLGGRSLLGHVLAAAEPLQAAATVVVVGSGREAVEEHLARIAPAALPVVQHEQNGSGHAAAVALAAVPDLDGAVLLVNGDAPLLRAGDGRRPRRGAPGGRQRAHRPHRGGRRPHRARPHRAGRRRGGARDRRGAGRHRRPARHPRDQRRRLRRRRGRTAPQPGRASAPTTTRASST